MQNRIAEHGIPASSEILYPILIVAAVLMIIFSVYCMAMVTSLVPRAESINGPNGITWSGARVEGDAGQNCRNCGVVEAVGPDQIRASAMLDTVAGGVTGRR